MGCVNPTKDQGANGNWLYWLSQNCFYTSTRNSAAPPNTRITGKDADANAEGEWRLAPAYQKCIPKDDRKTFELWRRPSDVIAQRNALLLKAKQSEDLAKNQLMNVGQDQGAQHGQGLADSVPQGAHDGAKFYFDCAKEYRDEAKKIVETHKPAFYALRIFEGVMNRRGRLAMSAGALGSITTGGIGGAAMGAGATLGVSSQKLVTRVMNLLDVQHLVGPVQQAIVTANKCKPPTSFLQPYPSTSSSNLNPWREDALDDELESAMQELERELGIDLREINVEENDLSDAVNSEVPTTSWLQQEWTAAATASPEGLGTSVSKKEDEEGAAASSDDESDMDDIEVN
eukprot:g15374.t1